LPASSFSWPKELKQSEGIDQGDQVIQREKKGKVKHDLNGSGPRLLIFGSRTLGDERVKKIILAAVNKYKAAVIVTAGEPGGACQAARELCREFSIPLHLFYLNFKYLRGAYEHRSILCFKNCDQAIFIHDGKSKGTAGEIKLAKKMKIKFDYFKLDPLPIKKNKLKDEAWAKKMGYRFIGGMV